MNCYYCGAKLNFKSTCPNCNADVRVWKKAVSISNILYNDGLEKADVRDLSNAVTSLQLSLQYNKMNIQARNLLGLVYFEQGEVVSALNEWVISMSFQPDNNRATEYIAAIQSDGTYVEEIGQTVKKYNQALTYCQQEAYDLAILQLKQVVSSKPTMIKAQQLLSLLYMRENRYDLAAKILKKCNKIDANNTDTQRYIKECKKHLRMNGTVKQEESETVTYTSGNDIIIRPSKFSDNHIAMTVINMLIGLAIGIAVMMLLVFPSVKQKANDTIVSSTVESNESLTTKEQTIETLNSKIDELESSLSEANTTISTEEETITAYKDLVKAYSLYSKNYYTDAAAVLDGINRELLDEDGVNSYDTMYGDMKASILQNTWNTALEQYTDRDYTNAIENMRKIMKIDESYRNGEVAYYLAFAYYYTNDKPHAYEYFLVASKYATEGEVKTNSKDMADMYKGQGITPAED